MKVKVDQSGLTLEPETPEDYQALCDLCGKIASDKTKEEYIAYTLYRTGIHRQVIRRTENEIIEGRIESVHLVPIKGNDRDAILYR